MSDAELLLGLGRHLSAYSVSPAHAAFESLQFAGQVYELAWRLRDSQISSAARITAIGVEAKIGPRQLDREVLPTMQQMGWIECQRTDAGQLTAVESLVPPSEELISDAGRLLDILIATAAQRAALEILRATTIQPLTREVALDRASEWGDEAAQEALRHLISVRLVKEVEGDEDRPVVFNPNIWTGDREISAAALRAEDARVNKEVGALIEEVAALPGIPEAHVKSTEPRWIDFAVSQGLVQRSVVQTSTGDEQRFLFTPHLSKDAFGLAANDPSGHVRQLVGSMVYAATFASWRLRSPGAFLYRLITEGEAGNVPNIGTDYPMLETAGTIQIVPGSWQDSYRMVLLRTDVAEAALEVIDSRGISRGDTGSLRALGDQRSYSHIERERARMATEAKKDDVEANRLIAALREVTARRAFGG